MAAYAWTCQVCGVAVEPNNDHCPNCGCPEVVSATEVAERKARLPKPTGSSAIPYGNVVSAPEVPGTRIIKSLGIVRGLTVRSRSAFGSFAASLETLVGGKNYTYTELSEASRQEAFTDMCNHASTMGANAIIAVRYDTNDIMEGVTEVLCYGTAVLVEPLSA